MGFFVKFIEAVIEKFINWFSRDAPKPAPVDPEGYNKEIERRKQEIEKLEQQQKNKNEEERRKNEEERLKIEEARRKNEEELKRKAEDLRLKKENFAALKNKRFEIRDPGMVQRYREEAKRKIDIDSVKKYNIAITGQTGSGKSSYVNAVRGIRDDDERAAKVDEKQVLTPMTKYQHPTLKTLDIWDCPGAGTAHHPLETYFMDKYLYMFDGLVIVYENRYRNCAISNMSAIKNVVWANIKVFHRVLYCASLLRIENRKHYWQDFHVDLNIFQGFKKLMRIYFSKLMRLVYPLSSFAIRPTKI